MAFTVNILLTIATAATPLLIAAIGELVVERSGVLNLGVEGMMIMGAACGFAGAYFTGSIVVGALTGMIAGAALAAVFALLTLGLAVNQVATGLALTILGTGLSGLIVGLSTLIVHRHCPPAICSATASATSMPSIAAE